MHIGPPTQVIEASQIGPVFPSLLPGVRVAVVISDASVLETYFANPSEFPCERYFVSLENGGSVA